MAKEKYSHLNCKETESSKLSVTKRYIIIPDRVEGFSFPSSQRKAKKISPSAFSAVKTTDPLKVTIKPHILRVVVNYIYY
jgi:hypothetical protein